MRTIEFGSWPAAVAALEGDLGSEGRTVHVFVRDETGRPVACGDYTLLLDGIAGRAFTLGSCDPQTSSTSVRLVNRHALFAHDDFIPRPLPAGIGAVEVRSTGARGGAGHVGGSELQCTLALRPFLTNLETGEHVYLPPGRFVMNVLSHDVNAVATAREWTLQARSRGLIQVEYEMVDTARHERVLHDRVSLQCGSAPGSDSTAGTLDPNVPRPPDPFVTVDPRTVPRPAVQEGGRTCSDAPYLSTRGLTPSTTHGGAMVPLFRIDAPYLATLRIRLSSSFGGELLWYRSCARGAPPAMSGVFGGGDDQSIRFPLDPGTYYLAVVDADVHAHDGTFWLGYEMSEDVSIGGSDTPGRAPFVMP
ncbi:MAG: hypothetical protein WCJ30_02165 [Deltaproteobacteria bacterium]